VAIWVAYDFVSAVNLDVYINFPIAPIVIFPAKAIVNENQPCPVWAIYAFAIPDFNIENSVPALFFKVTLYTSIAALVSKIIHALIF